MMRWYLASRYSRHPEMQEHAKVLEEAGQETVCRWIHGSHDMQEDAHGNDDRARFAIEDMEDLTMTDGVISFTEPPVALKPVKTPSKGGRHVEFGLGIALNKRMVVIGPREHVFHFLPHVEVYDCLEEFLSQLETENH